MDYTIGPLSLSQSNVLLLCQDLKHEQIMMKLNNNKKNCRFIFIQWSICQLGTGLLNAKQSADLCAAASLNWKQGDSDVS